MYYVIVNLHNHVNAFFSCLCRHPLQKRISAVWSSRVWKKQLYVRVLWIFTPFLFRLVEYLVAVLSTSL